MTAPLFEAHELRVAVDGAVALERLDLTTEGSRLALVGDVAPLLSLLMNVPLGAATLARAAAVELAAPEGLATVASGSLRLLGVDVATGEHAAIVGAVPLDPPMPPDFTATEYVVWRGRLSGLGRTSTSSAARALESVGLGRAGKRVLRTLSIPERRALVFAGGLVSSPQIIVAELPLTELEGPGAAFVSAALAAATEGRSAIVSLGRTAAGTPEGRVAAASTDLAFVSRGELVLSGAPAEIVSRARLYGLTVRSNAEALRAELAARGIELRGGPLRFSAALPDGTDTRDILAAAAAARSAVVELLSLM